MRAKLFKETVVRGSYWTPGIRCEVLNGFRSRWSSPLGLDVVRRTVAQWQYIWLASTSVQCEVPHNQTVCLRHSVGVAAPHQDL